MGNDYEDLIMECNYCHLTFYAPQLRLDPETDLMVCTNCLNASKKNKNFRRSKVMVVRDRLPRKVDIL